MKIVLKNNKGFLTYENENDSLRLRLKCHDVNCFDCPFKWCCDDFTREDTIKYAMKKRKKEFKELVKIIYY